MRTTLVIMLLVGAVEAHAKCAAPHAYFLPRPGTPLPPDPTLFFIVPPASYPKPAATIAFTASSETNAKLEVTSTPMPTVADFRIIKLSVKAPAGTKFAIDGFGGKPAAWSVEAMTLPADFTLSRGKDAYSSWTCSYESSRVLESSISAPAFRVEFAATEAELLANKGQTVVVEGQNDGFLRNNDKPDVEPQAPAVRLGHHNCWGANFVWKTAKVAVRVTALLPDGSERASKDIFILDVVKDWTEK